MYQYEGRNKNIDRRNKDLVEMFNKYPKKCPETGIRYDTRSVLETVAHHFYLSIPQVERVLSGRAEPKRAKTQKQAQTA